MWAQKNIQQLFKIGATAAGILLAVFLVKNIQLDGKTIKTDVLAVDSPIIMVDPPTGATLPSNFRNFAVKVKNNINLSTLNENNVMLTDKNGQKITSSVWFDTDSKIIWLQLFTELPVHDKINTYTLNLNNKLKDIYGSSIGPAILKYYVKNTPDNDPMLVSWTSPANSSTNVNPTSRQYILIGFNKGINPDSINDANWSSNLLSSQNATAYYEPETHAMRIELFDALLPDTRYDITLQSGVLRDASDNPMAGYNLTFTTGSYDSESMLTAAVDLTKSGFEILFKYPISRRIAIDPRRYSLICDGNQVDISNASFDYNVKERKLTVNQLKLNETGRCSVMVNPNFLSLDGRTFNNETRILTGNPVHSENAGKDYYNKRRVETTWFRWEECNSCKGIFDNFAKFFYPVYGEPLSNIAGKTGIYRFSLMLSQEHRTGDILKLIFPSGFDIRNADMPLDLINKNIHSDSSKIITFSNIKKDADTNTIELKLNMANGATIGKNGAQLKFTLDHIVNSSLASKSNAIRWKSVNSQGINKEGPHTFRPFAIMEKDDVHVTAFVHNNVTGMGISGIKVIFQGPGGKQSILTDQNGDATLHELPLSQNVAAISHIHAYIDANSVPSGFLTPSQSIDFEVTSAGSDQIKSIYLQPAGQLPINVTLTYPQSFAGRKISVWAFGPDFDKKTVILTQAGITKINLNAGYEGDYQIGASYFKDEDDNGYEVTNLYIAPSVMRHIDTTTVPINVTLPLEQTTKILTGSVRNENGKPMPNAHVTISPSRENDRISKVDVVTSTDGTFAAGIMPGNYTVEAYLKGLPAAAKTVVTVTDTDINVDLVIKEETIAISGVIKDGDGTGINNVNVSCFNNQKSVSESKTNSFGEYILKVYKGEWTCQAASAQEGYIGTLNQKQLVSANTVNPDFVYNRANLGIIKGKIVDDKGNAKINIAVGATHGNNSPSYSAQTDSEGKFAIRVERGDSYKIFYYNNNNGIIEGPNNILVGPNDADLGTIIFPQQNILTINTVNAPVGQGYVEFHFYNQNTKQNEWGGGGLFNSKGSSKFQLSSATYNVTAIIAGYARKTQDFTLSGLDKTINFDFADTQTATFTVQIKDSENGKPVEEALVEAIDTENNLFTETLSDANGQAALQITPGKYILRAGKKDYLSANIKTGSGSAYTINLVQASSTISGKVKDSANSNVAGAVINAVIANGKLKTSTMADFNGNFILPVGQNTIWNLTALSPDAYFATKNNVTAGTENVAFITDQARTDFHSKDVINTSIDPTKDNFINAGRVSLAIGANSLDSNPNGANILIKEIGNTPYTELLPAGAGVEISGYDAMGNSITQLPGAIGMQTNFDKEQILAIANMPNFNPKTFKGSVGYYDETSKNWKLLPTVQTVTVQRSPDSPMVTITIDEFIKNFDTYRNFIDYKMVNSTIIDHFTLFGFIGTPLTSTAAAQTVQQQSTQQTSTALGTNGINKSRGGRGGGGSSGATGLSGTAITPAPQNQPTETTEKIEGEDLIAPALKLNKTAVKKDDPIRIFGKGVPISSVIITIKGNEKISLQVNTESDGRYSYNLNTRLLLFDSYSVQAENNGLKSNILNFTVGAENILLKPAENQVGDLDNDGFISLTDFSILAYWYGQTPPSNPEALKEYKKADLNGDGVIDLQDFRILIINWTG